MLPYEQIQENPERKWHRQLLDRLVTPGVGEDELDDVWGCLAELDDARTVQPLLDIVMDTRYPDSVRRSASYALSNFTEAAPPELYRPWFTSADPVLQDAAFSLCDRTDADLILPMAQDPNHPRHKDAIGKMVVGFERPEHQQIKIRALSHPDPEVREWAADVLLWDEPVAALEPLLALTDDPVAAVVETACDTLQYYPTQHAYRRMREIAAAHSEPKVRSQAEKSIDEIRWGLLREIDDDACQPHLRRWLAPIWDMLQVTEEELNPPPQSEPEIPSPPISRRVYSIQQIDAFLDNPDVSPNAIREFVWDVDWLAVPEQERAHLVSRFVSHPDHVIRKTAPSVFEAWQHVDGLVALFHDPYREVHTFATYQLSQLTAPSREVAAMLWAHLSDPNLWGVHSYETLDAYVAHADPAEAIGRLTAMAEDRHQTETLRYHAVANLQNLKAVTSIEHLLPLVLEPPSVTWGFHDILLGAAYTLHLKPPPLTQYLAVDHAQIQTAIAPFVD